MSASSRAVALAAALCAALLAAGCSLAPAQRAVPAEYDFGLAKAAAPERALHEPILVYDVSAPSRLDTNAMLYRLAYADAAQPRAYADSRWAAPPAALLTARLRARLAAADPAGVLAPGDAAHAQLVLRVELQEFSQVFQTAKKSEALLELRATLLRDRRLSAQRSFVERVPAATPDARGGAAAFAVAGDRAIAAITDWVAANERR